jgi:hypothetical protein
MLSRISRQDRLGLFLGLFAAVAGVVTLPQDAFAQTPTCQCNNFHCDTGAQSGGPVVCYYNLVTKKCSLPGGTACTNATCPKCTNLPQTKHCACQKLPNAAIVCECQPVNP